MKKWWVSLLTVVVLGFICFPAWAADVVRMRFGHVAPPMHAQAKAAEYFAQYVEKESGGRIKCSTHPQGQLGSHIQMLESLQVGTLEMVSVAGSALTEFVPEIALTSMAFLFDTEDEMYALMAGPVGKKIEAAFEPKGLVYGGIADHGFKAFLNRKGPVTRIEDMGPFKWRVIPNELFLDNYEAMGASPITLPWPEVFSALQRGVIDGIDLTPNECWGAKTYEALKYMSLCKLGLNPQVYVASQVFLENLPEDLRQIMVKGMADAAQWHTAKIRQEDATVVLPDLKDKGFVINQVADAELARFRKAVAPVHQKWREKIGPALFDEALAFLKANRK
ncbi:DctP3: C4-TRAP dicarboxylate transporter periplasmatic binding protein [Desulfosarcina variabilis str. Montpellier]|uniref:TRAP transporter substrate-binding protein n=1 Tax=Desulfosarcina variabilis TaxID=2300 RepID=UPI003AFB3959